MRGRVWTVSLAALLALLAGPASAQRSFTITNGAASDTTAVGMADSSARIGVSGFRLTGLAMKVFSTGASAQTTTRIAVQIRWHKGGLSDSNSIVALLPVVRTSEGASATVDSVRTTGDALVASAVAPASTEFVVQFDRNGALWTPRFGKFIPFEKIYGGTIDNLDWVSVRWRVLGGPGVSTTWISLVVTR